MNKELKMSYETVGTSSFMTVAFPPDVQLVKYQMEMILSNEIGNFLPLSRQMVDGETVIYYNITSKISLKQVLDKRKLSRKELIHLLEGAILAVRDAAAYRLPSSGMVMEPEYIYVNPASCEPAFMFLPLQEPSGAGIKELVSELVLHDRIELSDDNFIQIILMELNRQPFSLEKLEESLRPYKKTKLIKEQDRKPMVLQQEKPAPQILEEERVQPEGTRKEPASAENAAFPATNKKPGLPALPKRKEENDKRAGKQKNPREKRDEVEKKDGKDGFDPDKAKKKFMLPQLLFMAALAAGVSFGLFTNESGGIVPKNILAFAIVAALAEWILYREIYVNSRYSKKTEGKKASTGKKGSSGKKPGRPEIPAQKELPIQKEILRPAVNSVREQQPMPYPIYGGEEETDTEGETEFWSEDAGNSAPAYLEYFENGRLSRIPVDSLNGVVVGRLKQQVDFEVKSPRVGKVHARFFCKEGQCYVVDINSKNGTYVNGSRTRIESNVPYPLHDKDRITLADSEFTIRCSES